MSKLFEDFRVSIEGYTAKKIKENLQFMIEEGGGEIIDKKELNGIF